MHVRHNVLFVMIQNSSVTYEISIVTEGFLFLPRSSQLANQSRQLGWLVLLPQSPLPDRQAARQPARQAARPEKYFLAKIELGHQIQSCLPQ